MFYKKSLDLNVVVEFFILVAVYLILGQSYFQAAEMDFVFFSDTSVEFSSTVV